VVFSRLTGVHVIASNYPGTTVEISKGYSKIDEEEVEVIDLPGAYSLEPTSKAEEVCGFFAEKLPQR
jgi:ferrous iron transport protein B